MCKLKDFIFLIEIFNAFSEQSSELMVFLINLY